MTEATGSSETSVHIYQATWRQIVGDDSLHRQSHKNLKFYNRMRDLVEEAS
jgi:hypothetical protein